MSNIRTLLKRAGLTAEQLSKGTGMSIRTIAHHYQTGRIPYTVLYKIKNATGLSMDEIVPKHLAEYWLSLWDEAVKVNKPRGYKKQNDWHNQVIEHKDRIEDDLPPDTRKYPIGDQKVSKMQSQVGIIPVDVPRENKKARLKKAKEGNAQTIPAPVKYPSVTPEKGTPSVRSKIADLMKAKPAPAADEGEAPDFSNIPDEVFATSMAAENNPIAKKRR